MRAGFNSKPYPGGPPPSGKGPEASTSQYLRDALAARAQQPAPATPRAVAPAAYAARDPIELGEQLNALKRELRAVANERDALVGRVNQLQAQCQAHDRLQQTQPQLEGGTGTGKTADQKDCLVRRK